jgi:hypothetical protein
VFNQSCLNYFRSFYMGIAFATVGSGVSAVLQIIFAPLNALVGFFAPWQAGGRSHAAATKSIAKKHDLTVTPQHFDFEFGSKPVQQRPVRVVRVSDAATPRHGAGRMVISGRMADVCAELDRLAAQHEGR